jgi:hypothetical protein
MVTHTVCAEVHLFPGQHGSKLEPHDKQFVP